MKAENTQLNVSEVSFARRKAGKNSFGKHNYSGISNVSKSAVDGRLFEKHECHALTPDQKTTMRIKRLTRGPVGKGHGGNVNGTGRSNGKGPTVKSLTHSIAALTTNIILACLMMMMMMDPQRRRKAPPTAQMLH
jgi:hypothetical protein